MDILIYKPFNAVFFASFLLTAAFCFIFVWMLRGKPDKTKRYAIAILYACVTVVFVVYKIFLFYDDDYSVIREANGLAKFNWWAELPLNLCNINMILVIISTLTNSRALLSFNFFLASLGAIFALVMPSTGFSGYSILLPRMLGYYITHFMVVIQTPILALTGVYRPRYKDMLKFIGLTAALTTLITGINFAFRGLGLSVGSNYFYSIDPESNPLLEIFYSIIPVPGLYIYLSGIILVPYMLIVTFFFEKFGKKQGDLTEQC